MNLRAPAACLFWAALVLPCGALAADEFLDLNDEAKGRAATEDMLDRMTGSGFRSLRGDARTRAIQAIFAKPQNRHIPDLCAILTQELDDASIEQQALAIALRLGGPGLVAAGTQLLQHSVAQRQAMGIQLLGASGTPEQATPALLGAARDPAKAGNADLRFELIRAFIRLKTPATTLCAREWSRDGTQPENAQWARLWLAGQGGTTVLAAVLSDHESIQKLWRQTNHDIDVMAPYWTAIQMRDARRQAARCAAYAEAFNGLLAVLDESQMQTVVDFLKRTPDCFLPDLLYQGLDRLLTPSNSHLFIRLLDAPYPRLQEEVAWRLVETGDTAVLTRVRDTLLAKQKAGSYLDRALAVRLVEVFAAEERSPVIARALADPSAYVVEEGLLAVRRLRPADTANLIAPILAGRPWQTNGRIQWLLQRVRPPGP